MKQYAFPALWAALVVQASWYVFLHGHADAFGVAVIMLLGVFGLLHGRSRWVGVPVRLLMGVDFLAAVCDRLGVFGPHGTPGTSWGDFGHFVTYTRQVASYLPGSVVPAVAVVDTVAEAVLGLALLSGVKMRITALASAALLFLFGISMSVSMPAADQFHYCVFLLCAGMLAVAAFSGPGAPRSLLWHNRACPLGDGAGTGV